MNQTLLEYLGWLLRPFFLWWWSAITGVASLIAFLWVGETIAVSRSTVLLVVFASCGLLFLALSVATQGWKLFSDRAREFEVVSFQRASVPEQTAEWVVQMRGPTSADTGTVLQIDRVLSDGHEVPFALVRTTGKNAGGLHQAVPLWLSVGGLNDFKRRSSSPQFFRVGRFPTNDCVQRVIEELSNGQL